MLDTPKSLVPAEQLRPVLEAARKPAALRLTGLGWVLPALCLAVLWFILINQLRGAWAADPQYSYGFVVPVLCLGLLLKRWQGLKDQSSPSLSSGVLPRFSTPSKGFLLAFSALAFLVLPTRLILEANPDWRMINWLLALETVGLTLALAYNFGGWKWVRQCVFPVAYILVAVPWPFTIERSVIQGLTRADVALVVEALAWLGIPAIQHGNVIQTAAGAVGVDEACSGIRSLQSSIMICLFMGEFYRLNLARRLLLVPLGVLLAFAFNVVRTSLLTWLAATKGTQAISAYHDEAGLTILLACSAVLWAIAWWMRRQQQKTQYLSDPQPSTSPAGAQRHPESSANPGPLSTSNTAQAAHRSALSIHSLAFPLLAWLLFVEFSVEAWYRFHESRVAAVPMWTVPWPLHRAAFTELPIPADIRAVLGYDEGHSGQWQTGDGVNWTINFYRWNPGKMQAWLAAIHRPDICLAAMGRELREQETRTVRIASLQLPFQIYTYDEAGNVLHVFHCFWDRRSAGRNFTPVEPSRFQRLRAVLDGQRNRGQQTLQLSLRGIPDKAEATKALVDQLQNIIHIEPFPQTHALNGQSGH